jgi:hypothetical protein
MRGDLISQFCLLSISQGFKHPGLFSWLKTARRDNSKYDNLSLDVAGKFALEAI